jgi:hypothetical protein
MQIVFTSPLPWIVSGVTLYVSNTISRISYYCWNVSSVNENVSSVIWNASSVSTIQVPIIDRMKMFLV